MLYEICAVIIIFMILIIWLVGPTKQIYKKYGGKSVNLEDDTHPDFDKRLTRVIILFVYAIGTIITAITEILFMLWTGSQGVFIAKYYALFLLMMTIIFVVKSKLKSSKMNKWPKKQPRWSIVYANITTVITLTLIVWALII